MTEATVNLLHLEAVHVMLEARDVLRDVTLSVERGELVCILGPNGAGKSTLLRTALGMLEPDTGQVSLGGTDPTQLAAAERARRAAYLPQRRPLAWAMSVRDVVALGRFAHGAAPGSLGGEDAVAVARALAACGLEPLAERPAGALSGGELSRVHVARALAAGAPLLLADEPVAALDPLHQVQVMQLLRSHVDAGNAALVVLHDVALAARFSDRLAWLAEGRIIDSGPARSTLTSARFAEVYGIDAAVSHADGEWSVILRDPR